MKTVLAIAALSVLPAIGSSQSNPGEDATYLIRGGTVISPTGQRSPNTNILIRNNRIVSGMVDANTGIGLSEIGSVQTTNFRSEMGEFNPHLKALVGLNVESELLGVTRMNGVTSVITTPTGGVIAGQATLINTAGWTWEDLAISKNAGLVFSLPGGGGGRGGRGGGGGRGGAAPVNANIVAEFEEFMNDSKAYDDARKGGSPKKDLIYEAMRPLFAKQIPAIINANSEQQIKAAIAFGEKWGVNIVINGGAQAYKVRKDLAAKKIPVVLGSIESAPGDDVPYDEIYAQPGLLYDAGVKFAFSTGGGSNARHVMFHAALAVAYGLKPEGALQALTIWPAEIFGADKDIGSIAQGKLANFFITTGDPMDLRTQVTDVFIKGRLVPDDDRHNRLYLKYKSRPLPVVTP
jgi:imidazolonepropionase-like amidohydrolase